MEAFKVTPEYVSNAAGDCERTSGQIQGELSGLRTYVLSLRDHWKGPAALQFDALMHNYDIYARMLDDALTDIASGLRGNYVNYSDTEKQNLNNLVEVGGSLPGTKLD